MQITNNLRQNGKKSNPWWNLTLLCTAFFMVVTDSTSVYSALPSIEENLQFYFGGSEWVIIIYMVVFAGLVLLGGRVSDFFGRKRMFLIGLLLFTISSALCGFSGKGEVLILGRLLQGVAAAVMTPAALSMVINSFDNERNRNKAIGIWGAMGGIGATGGLLIGGPITEWLGWEWIFFINVPIGILVFGFGQFSLKESTDRTISNFDVLGAVLITLFLLITIYFISIIPEYGIINSNSVFLICGSILLLFAFIYVETHSKDPLVPFRIFKSPTLVGGNILIIIAGMSVDGLLFIFTMFLQQILGYTATQFGLTMLAMTILSVVGVYAGQYLVTRFGLRFIGVLGMVFLATGIALVNFLDVESSLQIGVALSIFGFGMGTSFVVAQIAALYDVKEEDSGLASGVVETSFSFGGALGVAVLATVSQLLSGNPNPEILTAEGVFWAFNTVLVFGAVGIGVVLFYFRPALNSSKSNSD